MTRAEIERLVREALVAVAPDLEGEPIEPAETFRDQFEVDSIDFLNMVGRIAETAGIDIPEADYPRLETLSGAVAYLQERTATA